MGLLSSFHKRHWSTKPHSLSSKDKDFDTVVHGFREHTVVLKLVRGKKALVLCRIRQMSAVQVNHTAAHCSGLVTQDSCFALPRAGTQRALTATAHLPNDTTWALFPNCWHPKSEHWQNSAARRQAATPDTWRNTQSQRVTLTIQFLAEIPGSSLLLL